MHDLSSEGKIAIGILLKLLLALIVSILIYESWLPLWGASYAIRLKNGAEIKTNYYWEEGDQIKFYIYDGVVGLSNLSIEEIRERDKPIEDEVKFANEEKVMERSTANEKLNVSPQGKSDNAKSKTTGSSKTTLDINYQEKRTILQEKLEDATRRLDEATARKDKEAKENAWNEMVEVGRQISDLAEEVKKEYNGELPKWWH